MLDLVVYHQSNHVGCALVHKHWPGRISAILYLNIEAVIRFNNTVGIASKHNGLINAVKLQKRESEEKKDILAFIFLNPAFSGTFIEL